jgi:hypothetical protein
MNKRLLAATLTVFGAMGVAVADISANLEDEIAAQQESAVERMEHGAEHAGEHVKQGAEHAGQKVHSEAQKADQKMHESFEHAKDKMHKNKR